MPHLIVEASSSLAEIDFHKLLQELTTAFSSIDTVDPRAVKSRVHMHDIWVTGEGAPRFFLHCEARVVGGRPDSLRQQMSDSLFQILSDHADPSETSITVEVREMDPVSYQKSSAPQ